MSPTPVRRRPSRVLGVVAVATAVLAALLAPAPSAQAAGASYHLPKQGSCHQITWKQAGAETESRKAVRCSGKHTTKTVGVLKLRGEVRWSSAALVTKSLRFCRDSSQRALGASQTQVALSAYTFVFFYPTTAERRNGARWVRCDLALKGGQSSLQQLPDKPAKTLDAQRYAKRIARCLRPAESFLPIACTTRHSHRAASPVKLSGRRFPGDRALARKAAQVCPDRAGRGWTATYPVAATWKSGARVLICYRKD